MNNYVNSNSKWKKDQIKKELSTNLRNWVFFLVFEKPKIVWIEIPNLANYAYNDQEITLNIRPIFRLDLYSASDYPSNFVLCRTSRKKITKRVDAMSSEDVYAKEVES